MREGEVWQQTGTTSKYRLRSRYVRDDTLAAVYHDMLTYMTIRRLPSRHRRVRCSVVGKELSCAVKRQQTMNLGFGLLGLVRCGVGIVRFGGVVVDGHPLRPLGYVQRLRPRIPRICEL